ncbi:hypothetical protein SCOCK_60224 [Actinacidiphila cocklensis]|uniref:Uncharacterized protein n=1 Tax=Actinacidiphila cocklensis TaxID=887465 RepID=A0A9W4DYU2_9ACTN|nr:hypothetical protein SCOCK_60224 [Actinacidiphila cocklensis]
MNATDRPAAVFSAFARCLWHGQTCRLPVPADAGPGTWPAIIDAGVWAEARGTA